VRERNALAQRLVERSVAFRDGLEALRFRRPVAFVYDPLVYAFEPHARYLERYASRPKRVLFVGMNPGPYGMVQTGVPFGEVAAVRDWLGIEGPVERPANPHPKRPVQGFACTRSEVSGRRLWGLFADRYGDAEAFFREHFVANYCPLAFFDPEGRNLTPDRLAARDREALSELCDATLGDFARTLGVDWLVGIGTFAATRARAVAEGLGLRAGQILHPSPASPAANRDFAGTATRQLEALGLW
jgi:single-strand selective monofunctional uracil DNA glycosylase